MSSATLSSRLRLHISDWVISFRVSYKIFGLVAKSLHCTRPPAHHWRFWHIVDFLRSPSSCLFSTRQTKDFSYLIRANFSDPKTGRCALTSQRSPGYPLGTDLSNYAQRNVKCETCSSRQQLQDFLDFKVKRLKLVMWKSARDCQQTSLHFSSIEKQFKMFLHRRKSLYRALVIWTVLVCCCEFLRQYMYFSRTLSRLSWLQWNLDDSKLSLTSRIFRTTVSFLPAQFRHKMFVKSEPSPLDT